MKKLIILLICSGCTLTISIQPIKKEQPNIIGYKVGDLYNPPGELSRLPMDSSVTPISWNRLLNGHVTSEAKP